MIPGELIVAKTPATLDANVAMNVHRREDSHCFKLARCLLPLPVGRGEGWGEGEKRPSDQDPKSAKSPADPVSRFLDGAPAPAATTRSCSAPLPVLAAAARSRSASREFSEPPELGRVPHRAPAARDAHARLRRLPEPSSPPRSRNRGSSPRTGVAGEICSRRIADPAADATKPSRPRSASSAVGGRGPWGSWLELIADSASDGNASAWLRGKTCPPASKVASNPSPGLRPPSPHRMGRGQGEGLAATNCVIRLSKRAGASMSTLHHPSSP
jgi:hypothetical protein